MRRVSLSQNNTNKINNKPRAIIGAHKTNNMNKGTVKFFNDAKGFGFIKGENGQEVFVHATGLVHEIRENDEVTFDMENGKKGPSAINVTRI